MHDATPGRQQADRFRPDPADDMLPAEAVDGWYIGAPREALPTTAENEFYWGDLVGLDVVNESGESLGSVKGLLSTGAHDVLQVGEGETERLIPFVAAFVLDVDLAARRIRVAWGKDW